MAKAYMGVRLKTLRERKGLTQAALAASLKISPSYLNQIENDQRPLTVAVLLRLQAAHGVDLQLFSEDENSLRLSALQTVFADPSAAETVPLAEAKVVAAQLPAVSRVLMQLHKRSRASEDRLAVIADGDRSTNEHAAPMQPYEEVREFFYARHDRLAVLDERAEELYAELQAGFAPPQAATAANLLGALQQRLLSMHGIAVRYDAGATGAEQPLRSFDAASRTIHLAAALGAAQQAFQLGIQLALFEMAPMIDSFLQADDFSTAEARNLARIGFANHFAGALVLPNRIFQDTAEQLRYDIDLLSERFGVGFETVGHRLSTMRHAHGQSIPFFFVRVDRAGNISKRQSSADFHFSRTGGTCPLWNVYDAFSQPGRILTQLASMPDGRTYLWIARTVEHRLGGYGAPHRIFSVALGCDARHAHRLVYGDGIAADATERATPIGSGCKVCDRDNCVQRAFPALGRPLRIDPNARRFAPYAPVQ